MPINKRKINDESDSENEKPKKIKSQEKEEEITFHGNFNVNNFRSALRGNNFITELRHFLHVANKNPSIIGDYLQKHGKPLELVGAIERIESSNLFHCSYICNALELVLMEIISNKKELSDQGINASRFFMKSYSSIVESLIKSPSFSHRKVVLKLLTAIVCLEPQLGKQILNNFNFLCDLKSVEQLLSHSAEEIKNEKTTDTVRKAFIHFILAYLVEGNMVLIRNILDKSFLINALVNGLLFDDHVTVCLVLNTLSKYVLDCQQISKTKKIQIFNIDCTKSLVKLYQWLGPKGFYQKFINKSNNFDEIVDEEEKEPVVAIVHTFLITLLTSRKYGIAFYALMNSKQKHNMIQLKIINFIDKPWLSDLKLELISKILTACPELSRNTIKHYGSLINPFKTGHNSWVAVAEFNRKLIEHCHPKLMKNALNNIALTDYCGYIKDICLPIEILTHLHGEKSLKSKSFEHRLETLKLLKTMYKQYCSYMKAIMEVENHNPSDLRKLKLDILDHILLNFPTVQDILVSMDLTIRMIEENEQILKLKHLDVTLDLIILICQNNKSFVNKTSGIIHFLDILRPLYAAEGEVIEGLDSNFKLELELKAVKTMLLLSPKSLNPNLDIFKNIFKSFMNAYVYGFSTKIRLEAKQLLHGLFLNTGVFNENSKLEIDIWLEALRYFDKKTVKIVTKVLLQCFQSTETLNLEMKNYDEMDSSFHDNLQSLFKNIENNFSAQGYVEHIEMSKLLIIILKGVAIGDSLKKYLQLIIVLLFHYLPQNKILDAICSDHLDIFEQFPKFSKNWLKKEISMESVSLFPNLSEIYLKAEKGNLNIRGMFSNDVETFQMKFSDQAEEVSLPMLLSNVNILQNYLFIGISIVNRLFYLEKLTHLQSKNLANFIADCFEIIKHLEDIDNDFNDIEDSEKMTNRIIKYFYNNNFKILKNFSILANTELSRNFLLFVEEATSRFGLCIQLGQSTTLFRQKIINEINISVLNSTTNNVDVVKVFEVFKLTEEECIDILGYISLLKYNQITDKSSGSKTTFFDILVLTLNRLSELKRPLPVESICLNCIGNIYKEILENVQVDSSFEKLEEALTTYLKISYQHITDFEAKNNIFRSIFNHKRITKSAVKLALLLLERIPDKKGDLFELLPKHFSKKELVYPLIDLAVRKNMIEECSLSTLSLIYQEFKNGFMKTIEKPQKAGAIYKENPNASIFLINQCMPLSECIDFTKKNLKIEQVEIFQIKLINSIYEKALQNGDADKILTTYLQQLIQILQTALKKLSVDDKSLPKIMKIGFYIFKLFEHNSNNSVDYEKIIKSQNWSNLCKSILKQCIYLSEDIMEDELNSLVLKLLAFMFDKLYENGQDNVDVKQYFEMIFSHSKFLEVLLSTSTNIFKVKTEMLHLLTILALKNQSVLEEKQIPILLGAYDAKLTHRDRYILALLQMYEEVDINLNTYRPFIWGESAVAFYSLRDEEARNNLKHQETSISQVMSLIEFNRSDYTLKNFPVWRKLNTLKQLPNISFKDPENNLFDYGNNALEKLVERGEPISPEDLKLCPKREGIFEECYDPSFLIPLMAMSFAPDVYSQPVRPVQNGLLSIVFAGLSSLDRDMRLAAGCAQIRYREHFEASKFFEKPIWSQGYDNIQTGLEDLKKAWAAKRKKNYGIPRVSYIPGIFLSRTFNCLVDPTHEMYKPLTMYLRLKQSFNFQCVPEFNVFFYSPEVEHQVYRKFILEVIRDGLKCNTDLFLLIANNIFKSLMGYYNSTVSTLEINLLILSVISTSVKIPATSKIIVEHIGIIPWLANVINGILPHHYDTIEGVLNIISNLWFAVKANAKDFFNFKYVQIQIYRVSILLLPKLSRKVNLKSFSKYLNVLLKTGKIANAWKSIPEEHIVQLIDCGQKHFENYLWHIENIKHYGAKNALSFSDFVSEINSTLPISTDEDTFRIQGISSLREFVILWKSG